MDVSAKPLEVMRLMDALHIAFSLRWSLGRIEIV